MFEIGDKIILKSEKQVERIVKKYWPEFTEDNQRYLEAVLTLSNQVFEVMDCRKLYVDRFQNNYQVIIDHPVNHKYWLFDELFEKYTDFIDEETSVLFGAT